MKKTLVIVCILAMGFVVSKQTSAVITGSAHDFSGESWAAGQICQPCHIPHLASSDPFTPLWGHDNTQVNYQDNLVSFYGTVWGSVNGPTLMCLSCHDGTVALDSYGGNIGTEFIDPEYDIVPDDASLAGNHPVSVAYDETLIDFNSEASVIAAGLKFFNIETSADVECGTCHDVHNSTNIEGLLWISNAGSALCLACHNK
jgi:predicted CXXCH cytochrome family protein